MKVVSNLIVPALAVLMLPTTTIHTSTDKLDSWIGFKEVQVGIELVWDREESLPACWWRHDCAPGEAQYGAPRITIVRPPPPRQQRYYNAPPPPRYQSWRDYAPEYEYWRKDQGRYNYQ